MKLRTMAKDPELYGMLIENLREEMNYKPSSASEKEREAYEAEKKKVEEIFKKYFRWGEYVDIEIDTEAGTCKLA